jgi:single-strand DNA-binding protein
MANLNKVLLIGRLTRDPETKYIPSGAAVTEFGFAVNRYYTVNGERKEDTCFIDISAWGRLGEQVTNYLRKGSQAFIEGHLIFSEWQTQEGQKRTKLRVTAETVQFLDPANRNQGGPRSGTGENGGQPTFRDSTPPAFPEPESGQPPADAPGIGESEVPF